MIAITNLSKSFGGVTAVRGVDLSIADGEIHALVGANGSGKSTVVKSLAGYHETVDSGTVTIDGVVYPLPLRVRDVHRHGIRLVHQDLGLVEQMTLVDNMCLSAGYPTGRLQRIDWPAARAVARRQLEELELSVHPSTLLKTLGPAERVVVAVARATARTDQPGILILDEPTAAVPTGDIARIIHVIRSRQRAGWAILYISHRLDEVLSLADRITVIRDGQVVSSTTSAETDADALSRMIVGPASATAAATRAVGVIPVKVRRGDESSADEASGPGALVVTGLSGRQLYDVSLAVRPGAVVCVSGPTGSGKSELGRILSGAELSTSGTVTLAGRPVHLTSPRSALAHGISYVPQDRVQLALYSNATLRENISGLRMAHSVRRGRINRTLERANAHKWMTAFGIVPAQTERLIATMSGGNQQKAVLARSAQSATELLILDDPTAGVDVGARAQIQAIIAELAATGLRVIVLSTEVDELVDLCSEVVILRGGRVTARLDAPIEHAELAEAMFAGSDVRRSFPTPSDDDSRNGEDSHD